MRNSTPPPPGKLVPLQKPLDKRAIVDANRKREAARKRYAGRQDVIAKQKARAEATKQRLAHATNKRNARVLKRKRAAVRGPINELTMSPGTIEAVRARLKKAGAAALKRRMQNPNFAARYRQKMLGRNYREHGRLLGERYKAPIEKRKTSRTSRVQRGTGMKKGKIAHLLRNNTTEMRMGDHARYASLIDYAAMMQEKARAAYARTKAKREARVAAVLSSLSPSGSNRPVTSPLSNLGPIGSISPRVLPTRPRTTRATSAARSMAQAAAVRKGKRVAVVKKGKRTAIPTTTRLTRSMARR